MRKTFTAFAATALALGFAASDAQAGPILQGLGNNGITLNALTDNALTLNGQTTYNGIGLVNGIDGGNGVSPNGLGISNGLQGGNGVSFNGVRESNGLGSAGIGGVVTALTLPGGGATLPMLAR